MKLKITEPVTTAFSEASALLGVSSNEIANRFLEDTFYGRLEADGTAFLIEQAMMHPYGSRAAAEAALERLEERVINESLEGNCLFVMSAEVVEEDGAYWIRADLLYPDNPNREGWKPAIS